MDPGQPLDLDDVAGRDHGPLVDRLMADPEKLRQLASAAGPFNGLLKSLVHAVERRAGNFALQASFRGD